MERVILHCDCDCFYASVEMLYHPEYRHRPMAVGGDPTRRHGIVLAKNQAAKMQGVKTGEALWQAQQKCPDIIFLPPRFPLYQQHSAAVREIFSRYTDQVEAFGLDECWLDVTGSRRLFGDGETIARRIQKEVREELGITLSVGVSFNKTISKLGSDYRKPNGITLLPRSALAELVWPLPVERLLMVGPATTALLKRKGIRTIGQLANANPSVLKNWMGKRGELLYAYANGWDNSPVARFDELQLVKSIGNSTTTCRDLTNREEISQVFLLLADSVARRLRKQGLEAKQICISLRDTELHTITHQMPLSRPTCLSGELHHGALELFEQVKEEPYAYRSIGITAQNLCHQGEPGQLLLGEDPVRRKKQKALETAVDDLRRRFGSQLVRWGGLLTDLSLTGGNPSEEHTIHPAAFHP